MKGINQALKNVREKVFGISPIIEGSTVKGPADKLLAYLNYEATCIGVAKYYKDILGNYIIDSRDCIHKNEIEELDIKTYCYDTLMVNIEKKKELARFLIDL